MTVARSVDTDAEAVEACGSGHRIEDLQRRGDTKYDMCQRGERESPREILGKAILVISGQGRKMYQYLEPKPEGTILPKRSMPQEAERAPHDTGTSMANWLEWNIQGGGVAATPSPQNCT